MLSSHIFYWFFSKRHPCRCHLSLSLTLSLSLFHVIDTLLSIIIVIIMTDRFKRTNAVEVKVEAEETTEAEETARKIATATAAAARTTAGVRYPPQEYIVPTWYEGFCLEQSKKKEAAGRTRNKKNLRTNILDDYYPGSPHHDEKLLKRAESVMPCPKGVPCHMTIAAIHKLNLTEAKELCGYLCYNWKNRKGIEVTKSLAVSGSKPEIQRRIVSWFYLRGRQDRGAGDGGGVAKRKKASTATLTKPIHQLMVSRPTAGFAAMPQTKAKSLKPAPVKPPPLKPAPLKPASVKPAPVSFISPRPYHRVRMLDDEHVEVTKASSGSKRTATDRHSFVDTNTQEHYTPEVVPVMNHHPTIPTAATTTTEPLVFCIQSLNELWKLNLEMNQTMDKIELQLHQERWFSPAAKKQKMEQLQSYSQICQHLESRMKLMCNENITRAPGTANDL